jgi:sulfate transport system ATP-binding protein
MTIPIASATSVALEGVQKKFGRFAALNGVSLEIAAGELLALLGPSGSGKTTLLRIIAGLEFPDAGEVKFGDQTVTFAKAAERGVGFVFQHYALFKHMTVAKNVAFGLDVKKGPARPGPAERAKRVEGLLDLVELHGMGERYPSQLSGGQRQRVALARALAVSPRILLLDEPFGALDATVRKTLRRELRNLHDSTGLTTVFVTHDQEEAVDLADRIAVLNHGRIEQTGSPQTILENPASAFVAGFIGQANALEGGIAGGVFRYDQATCPAPGLPDGPATAFIRPDQLRAATGEDAGFAVRLRRVTPRGPFLWLEAVAPGGEVVEIAAARDLAPAPEVGALLRVALGEIRIFPRGEGNASNTSGR